MLMVVMVLLVVVMVVVTVKGATLQNDNNNCAKRGIFTECMSRSYEDWLASNMQLLEGAQVPFQPLAVNRNFLTFHCESCRSWISLR